MKKIATALTVITFGIAGTMIFCAAALAQNPRFKACPMLVRICPDGVHTSSAQGPNCEFNPCPGEPGYKEDETIDQPAAQPPETPPNQHGEQGSIGGYEGGQAPTTPPPPELDNRDVPTQSIPIMPSPTHTITAP